MISFVDTADEMFRDHSQRALCLELAAATWKVRIGWWYRMRDCPMFATQYFHNGNSCRRRAWFMRIWRFELDWVQLPKAGTGEAGND